MTEKPRNQELQPYMDQAWEKVRVALGIPELTEPIKALAQQHAINFARELKREAEKSPKAKMLKKFTATLSRLITTAEANGLTKDEIKNLIMPFCSL